MAAVPTDVLTIPSARREGFGQRLANRAAELWTVDAAERTRRSAATG